MVRLAGVAVAITARLLARNTGQRYAGRSSRRYCLLPSACTLLLLHLLRVVGAIPFPVDLISGSVSIGAAIMLLSLWFLPNPLRPSKDLRVMVPIWVPIANIAASLVYPTLKTLWALGIDVAAPPGTVGVVDPPFTRQWQSLSSRHLLWLLLCAGGTVHRRRGCGPRLSLAVSFFCLLACPACGASRKALEKMPPLGYSSTEAGLSEEQQSLQPQDASPENPQESLTSAGAPA